MPENISIQKHPHIQKSEDYHFLRTKGLEHIQELGSKLWTDYNIHDPGITMLELLCYAITDLGYRTSFDIKDFLASLPGEKNNHEEQAFFTAREILTINPWTVEDFRKLLVDINGIKNAWLFCKDCPCNKLFLYANCEESKLQYSPAIADHEIIIKGFYDVLVEFEDEEGVGDLNSGKIKYNFSYLPNALDFNFSTATIEMRLPCWQDLEQDKEKYKAFRRPESRVESVTVRYISGNKTDDVNVPESEFAKVLRRPVYATLDIVFVPDHSDSSVTEILTFEDIPFTVWFSSDADRKALKLADLVTAIEDFSNAGIIPKYLEKIKKADQVIAETSFQLHQHRNLSEDFCSIEAIRVEDMAICADLEVKPDADIEKVLAEAYFLIDQYFSPDIRFYSLQQLLEKKNTVDEIFDGPQLRNGFIDNQQLESTQLKKQLFTSDIINLLMDVEGVVAVKNLVIARYDKEGTLVQSESWEMQVSYNHQPRLYLEGSKFLVYKNGLPFLPDKLELSDTMQVIKGAHVQPQFSVIENDLPVPEGEYFPLNQYTSIQNNLPLTYGVGREGLPSNASAGRRAQAKQLKAYLLVFEQILVNYLEQLSHVKDLFSLDPSISQSYFSRLLAENDLAGINVLYAKVGEEPLTSSSLKSLTEDATTFLDRRNRFLNHLMGRFAEQFTDYALMLYSYTGNKKLADETLIKDKISFIKDLPFMSSNRAKAFNYKNTDLYCSNLNNSGLQKRIERLLGFRPFSNHFQLYEEYDADDVLYERRWRLKDADGKIYLSGSTRYCDNDVAKAEEKARAEIAEVVKWITNEASYEIKKEKVWVVNLLNQKGEVIATRKQTFKTEEAAKAARDQIIDFAKKAIFAEKIIVVEHLLLRPRNRPGAVAEAGDVLLPVCIPANCSACTEHDPYSFRLTIVMNGEAGLANAGIPYRRFAEDTIRKEVPAHLALKICWVGNEQLQRFEALYCSWLSELSKAEPDEILLSGKLKDLLAEFVTLKSIYPAASLHDCADGNDENRVFLNQTII